VADRSAGRRCWGITAEWRRCRRRGNWYFFCNEHRWQWPIWIKSSSRKILTVVSFVAAIFAIYSYLFPTIPTKGVLVPDNLPRPSTSCGNIPSDNTVIILGNSAIYGLIEYPYDIIRIAGESILSIDKRKNKYFISAKTFSSDGRIVAKIENNEFIINPNNYFHKKGTTKHRFVVYDQQDRKVTDIHLLNSKAIKVLGIFTPRNRYPIFIEEDKMEFNTRVFKNVCIGWATEAAIIIN
jgi:hypothetical protein